MTSPGRESSGWHRASGSLTQFRSGQVRNLSHKPQVENLRHAGNWLARAGDGAILLRL